MTSKKKQPGGKKPKAVDLLLAGDLTTVTACPHRRRLCVIKNPGKRKGYLLLRCSDAKLVAWARLKGHACDALERLEELLDVSPGAKLQEKTVRFVRQQLSTM